MLNSLAEYTINTIPTNAIVAASIFISMVIVLLPTPIRIDFITQADQISVILTPTAITNEATIINNNISPPFLIKL